MTIVTAEVEKTTKTLVHVDTDKLLASQWGEDRSNFDSDQTWVKWVLDCIGRDEFLEPSGTEDELGILVEGEYDEIELSIL